MFESMEEKTLQVEFKFLHSGVDVALLSLPRHRHCSIKEGTRVVAPVEFFHIAKLSQSFFIKLRLNAIRTTSTVLVCHSTATR